MSMKLHSYLGPYIECERADGTPSFFDVDTDEALFEIHVCEGKLFAAPNIKRDGAPSGFDALDTAAAIDLSNVDKIAEKKWLCEAFAFEIKVLEKAYGRASIRWGLCQWWS